MCALDEAMLGYWPMQWFKKDHAQSLVSDILASFFSKSAYRCDQAAILRYRWVPSEALVE
jgi:hypothetical protein